MRRIINFNHKWAFTKDTDRVPEVMPTRWNIVNLPHTWNNIDGQDGGDDYYRGNGYYAKSFKMMDLCEDAAHYKEKIKDKEYYLEIQGANSCAAVYLNGREIGYHEGGYATWNVRMTDMLEDENLLVIVVNNESKDTVYPVMADFTFYGGLYRNVSVIETEKVHFALEYFGGKGIKITPDVDISQMSADIDIETWVSQNQRDIKVQQAMCEVRCVIKDSQGQIVGRCAQKVIDGHTASKIRMTDIHLWNGKKDPYLYTLDAMLYVNGYLYDTVSTKFGCRTFKIDADRGFFLNDKPYPLHGVARHQDRWQIGNALLPEHHKEDMELICEMGANTIRLAHYQHDQYFYDLCDENGMIVWAEIPYISRHRSDGRANTIQQMKELVIQNYNHPSIVVWGLSNEVTMCDGSTDDLLENHKILNQLVHELDATRKTVVAVVSMCDIHDPYIKIPDVVSYNLYFGWYDGDTSMNGPFLDKFHHENPDIPIGLSEYGCEGLNWHGSELVKGDYTEEYQSYYHEELIKQLFTRPYIWATHVWNMFDFGCDGRNEGGEAGQNHKGLVTFDRKYKKDAFYAYKAWLSDEPFVHICGKRYIDRVEDVTRITVYSNQPEVELFVNGKTVDKVNAQDHFFYFNIKNEGESKLCAIAGDCQDESFIRKVDKINEIYRYKETGPVLNWFDITTTEEGYSLNDKIEEVLLSDEAAQLLKPYIDKIESKNKEPLNGFLRSLPIAKVMLFEGVLKNMEDKAELIELNQKLNHIKRA